MGYTWKEWEQLEEDIPTQHHALDVEFGEKTKHGQKYIMSSQQLAES